jgi:membrane-bound lytic murein transglycosylase B
MLQNMALTSNFVKNLVQNYQVNKRVIENDKCQPEFTLSFSEYIEQRISDLRIKNGINKYNKYKDLLEKIELIYNVQPRFIISIWGLETAYGEITGNYPVIESLLTMSYDERRRKYFTKELFNSFKIIEEGHIDIDNFKGSWAGAMGQNQFMPSSFLIMLKISIKMVRRIYGLM